MSKQGNAVDLINLKTDKFTLNIKGKPVHPKIKQIYPERNEDSTVAKLEIDPVNCKINSFYHYDPEKGKKEYSSPSIFPFFYEEQDYQIFIEGHKVEGLEFYHENKAIREAVSKMPGKEDVLWGNINFRSDVGYSELEIRDKTGPLLYLKIEVFPSKIDYRDDYYRLLREVNEEVYNLAYDFLRRTFQGMKLKEARNVTHVEFFSILQNIFADFLKAFKRIQNSPHHRLHKTHRVLPAARVKKVNKKSIKWLRKNPDVYDREASLPIKMLNVDKKISFDTFENKFVKWIIFQLIKRITTFKRRYCNSFQDEDNIDQHVLNKADGMIKRLDYLLTHTFLTDVGELHKIDSLSLVLQMAPGYKEVYRYYLMLLKGLSLEGELFRLSMKQVWQLYEYWCFLKLNRILQNKYNLIKTNIIEFDYSGIYVTLNTSKQVRARYKNPRTKEEFTLTYNTSEGEGITTGQRPDNVLSLQKKGSSVEYKFVFDAKYRINPAYPDTHYHKAYKGIPGPEEDTINTMHRYRDAIVHASKDKYERLIVGAYVLFPYHDEEKFQEHLFYKSIEKVNVGAFPFLPGSTNLISDFLEDIIEESHLWNYERNILPAGIEDYHRDINFETNVLVGSLKNRRQFEIIFEKEFYYIPYQESILNHDLEYVAIYRSKKSFGKDCGVKYYGRIKNMEIKKRKEIEVPTKRNLEKNYIVFNLDKWDELEEPVKPEGYGVRGSHIYTNIMLLEKAKTVSELSIKSLEEWRAWLELKRIQPEVKILLADNKIGSSSLVEGFKLKDMTVRIKGGSIFIDRNNKTDIFSEHDFLYNLRKVIKELFKDEENKEKYKKGGQDEKK